MSSNGFTVESHFSGKEAATRKIYENLLKTSRNFGTVVEDPKKTSIHLVNKTAFAGVATRNSAIILTIKSDRKLSSPRVHKSEQTSARRFHHEVRLTSPGDVDAELTSWLKAAFELRS
ncbi:MAG: DUF5655 domain-containing protein [Pyrinomonadaceae bacterium]